MYNFIDLHCHMLFGVDDGAENIEMSKNMLNIAYQDGIRVICFTPHFKRHHFNNAESIKAYNSRIDVAYLELTAFAKERYPDLTLLLGSEIMFHNEICTSLNNEECKFIGQSKYVLIEFRPESTEFEIKNTVFSLQRRGHLPIIAHIERYACLIKKPALLDELKKSGAVLQINANSILRFKFGKTASFIKACFKKGLVDIVCTDAHDDCELTPSLSPAFLHVCKKFGDEIAHRVFYENPLKIISNEKIQQGASK